MLLVLLCLTCTIQVDLAILQDTGGLPYFWWGLSFNASFVVIALSRRVKGEKLNRITIVYYSSCWMVALEGLGLSPGGAALVYRFTI